MRNTLICTVGTSLFDSNLKHLCETTINAPLNWKELRHAYDSEDWSTLANELLKIDPKARICGAEINTIEGIHANKWLELENLFFLVSDTPAGENTGKVLRNYFWQRDDLRLKNVDYERIEKLQDKNPKDFKVHGLRNLVRKIGDYIQRFGGVERIAIDATGGYKAQIAIAVLLGQSLNIPVYYKHERFPEIIDFPPMPISLDYDILGRNSDILTDFERSRVFTLTELEEMEEKLRVFLTEVEIDGEICYELNPIGQVYLTSFRVRYPKPSKLRPATPQERKPPTFRDDHYPEGFKNFVNQVWQENQWITTCYSLPYSGQKSIKGIGFYIREEESAFKLIGTFQDKNLFGARFQIRLTDEYRETLTWVADQLNRRYR